MLRRSLPAIFIAFHLIICVINMAEPVDDAYISYRYSKNLALGDGLTYNPGERVEGYSNFTWVMLLSAISPESNLHPVVSQYMGILFELIALLLVYRLSALVVRSDEWALFALGLCSIYWSAAIWSVSGLETAMYSALLLAAVYFMVIERPVVSSIMALMAALTRPEGPIIFIMIVVSTLLVIRRQKRMIMFSEITGFTIFVAGYGAYMVFKWIYFGSILPNTYYAKVEGTSAALGALYIFGHLFFEWGPSMLVLVPLVIYGCMKPRERTIVPATMLLVYLVFVVASGGDWMPHGRFMVPIMPVAFILLARALKRLQFERKRRDIAILSAALVVFPMLINALVYEMRPGFSKSWHRDQGLYYKNIVEWGKNNVKDGNLVAIGDIGHFGYLTKARVIDTMGLVDVYLAKLPGQAGYLSDPEYVLSKKPDYVVSMVRTYMGEVQLGHSAFDRALLEMGEDKFLEKYNYRKVATLSGFTAEDIPLGELRPGNLFNPPKRRYYVNFHVYSKKPDSE